MFKRIRSVMLVLCLLMWAAKSVRADDCLIPLFRESRPAPFSGLRALATHAKVLEWEARNPGAGNWVLPASRDYSDESLQSRALVRSLGLEASLPALGQLATIGAPAQSYETWRRCMLGRPGLHLAFREFSAERAVLEIIWSHPPGWPLTHPIQSWLSEPWTSNHQVPRGQLFPGQIVNGSFHWEAIITNPTPAQAPLMVAVQIGDRVQRIDLPVLPNLDPVQFPRRRDALARGTPYTGLKMPHPNPAIPGEHLWNATDGCHFAARAARRTLTPKHAYRMEWSGACADGWMQGTGTLRWVTRDGMASVLVGHFERGELVTGDHWWVGSDPKTDEPKALYRTVFSSGTQTFQREVSMNDAPNELAASFKARLETAGVQSGGNSEKSSESTWTWFTPAEKAAMGKTFMALLNGFAQYAEVKAADQRVKLAERNYEAHKQSRSNDHNQGARLLGEQIEAQRNLKARQAEMSTQGHYAQLDAEFSAIRPSRGAEAPDASRCMKPFDHAGRDATILKTDRTRYYQQLCPSMTVGVFQCTFTDRRAGEMQGRCNGSPHMVARHRGQVEMDFGDRAATGAEVQVLAFCLEGSRPTEFTASESTRSTGIGWYRCVWN